jgi:hypothetical protein
MQFCRGATAIGKHPKILVSILSDGSLEEALRFVLCNDPVHDDLVGERVSKSKVNIAIKVKPWLR